MKKTSLTPLAQSHLAKGYVCVQFNADQIYLHAPEKELEDVVCYDELSRLELLDLGLAELMDTHHGHVKTYDEKELVAAHENGESWVAELNLIAEVSVDKFDTKTKEGRIAEFNFWQKKSGLEHRDIAQRLGLSWGAYVKFRNGNANRLLPVEMIIAMESMAKNEPPSLGRLTTMQQRIVKAAMDNVAFGDSHGNC